MLQRVLCGRLGINHCLNQRVAGQAVTTVQTSARALTKGIQLFYAGLSVQVHLDTTAHIVGGRTNGDIIGSDIDTHRQALLVDIGEVLACLGRILMGHIQTYVIQAVNLHLLIDGTRHDITWCQRQTLVILLHKRLAIRQLQYATITTHSLGNQEGGVRFVRVMQHGGVELYKLHIGHRTLGTIHHSDTVASSNHGVRCGQIHSTATTGTHHGHLCQIGIHLLGIRIQHVGTIAVNVWRTTCNSGT